MGAPSSDLPKKRGRGERGRDVGLRHWRAEDRPHVFCGLVHSTGEEARVHEEEAEEKGKRPPPPKKENIPGCVLRFEKWESVPECSREDLRSCCEKAGGQVKYVEFSRETRWDTCGSVLPVSLDKLTSEPSIKDTKVSASILDGDAEGLLRAPRGDGRRVAEAGRRTAGGGRRGKRQRN